MGLAADGPQPHPQDALLRHLEPDTARIAGVEHEAEPLPVEERAAFYAKLQANFGSIYPDAGVTHVDVVNNLEAVVRG